VLLAQIAATYKHYLKQIATDMVALEAQQQHAQQQQPQQQQPQQEQERQQQQAAAAQAAHQLQLQMMQQAAAGGAGMPASAEARIVRTMIELGAFIERTAMYCPRDIKYLMCTNLETMQQPDGELARVLVLLRCRLQHAQHACGGACCALPACSRLHLLALCCWPCVASQSCCKRCPPKRSQP
jgi:hypothetical protein